MPSFKTQSKQTGNHKDPTSYSMDYGWVSHSFDRASVLDYIRTTAGRGVSNNTKARLRERLSTRIRGASRASVGVSLAGASQSYQMIAKRASQMTASARALRRGDVRGAIRHLTGKLPSRKQRRKVARAASRSSANGWLELQFGWLPLLGDIQSASEVLIANPELFPVRVGITDPFTGVAIDRILDYGWRRTRQVRQYSVRKQAQAFATARVSNPNLALASDLGLTNPAHIAWDLVPFSFVVDWFIPVGRMLKQIDSFYGFDLTRTCVSYRTVGFGYVEDSISDYGGPWIVNPNTVNTSKAVTLVRELGVPSGGYNPLSYVGGGNPLSRWHAITSVALLSQTLSGFLSQSKK